MCLSLLVYLIGWLVGCLIDFPHFLPIGLSNRRSVVTGEISRKINWIDIEL